MIQTDTLKNGYKIIQDSERFQFGIDAVLLADFAAGSVNKGDRIIDLGTGSGIIPLLMAKKVVSTGSTTTTPIFTGLEIQRDSADMAAQSMALNGLEKQIKIVCGDLKNAGDLFTRHSFNVVTCNPPYMIVQHGKGNESDAKSIARHELLCTLEDVVAAAEALLASHGKFFMIHRPFRLPEIFSALEKHKLEMKRMRLIQPFADKEPNMVLIEARKNAKRRLKIEPPLIVRDDNGIYTAEVQAIYEN